MITMRKAIDIIQMQKDDDNNNILPARLHVTFEEHPASDEALLRRTLNDHNAWFQEHDITYSVLMKSFYETLFPPSSIDLILCYICLHWLDTAKTTDTTNLLHDWKRGKIPKHTSSSILSSSRSNDEHDYDNIIDIDDDILTKFVYMNEMTTPKALQEKFRLKLAHVHLARFFALRARELRPGGEALVMMVSRQHDWICPAPDDKDDAGNIIPSPLLIGVQQCVEQGLLRKEVLQRTLVPYYLRTTQDVLEALELAQTLPISETQHDNDDAAAVIYPGSWLELVDMRHYPVHLSGGLPGTFELLWAIHKSSIVVAGPTEAELESIRQQVKMVFCASDSSSSSLSSQKEEGKTVSYLACVVRRREDT